MAPRLKILSNVIERLAKLNAAVTGHLYGVMYEETLTVLTFSINPVDDDENKIQSIDLQLCMPAEVDLFGILYVDQYKQDIPNAFKDIDVTDNPLLIKYSLDAADVNAFYYIHQKLEAIKYEIIYEKDIWQNFCYVRLLANLPFISEKSTILNSLQQTKKNLASGKVGFHFLQNNIYLLGNDSNNGLENKSAKELLNSSGIYDTSGINKNNNSSGVITAITAGMFLKMSNDKNSEETVKFAPVVQHIKGPTEYYEFNLKIDTLSLVGHNITMAQLYEILVESICRNLRLIGSSFKNQLEIKDLQLRLPEPMHFKPLNFGHLLTLVYPTGMSALETFEYRKSLHRRLALDMTKPYFRRGNAVRFQNDCEKEKYLVNPHEAVSSPENCQISLVKGLYVYHHYMQDGFDDNGWGCAYRSLQTIVSWYRLQGYTDKQVPSHKEIQECLVDIGDKPSNFIGSKQWIGSTEVGFVLESLLDVSIKVLCASSGEKMSMLVSDLAHHFQTQGTPVMIGGGVLAHTILGVSCDEYNEDIRFLILDPHYTGRCKISDSSNSTEGINIMNNPIHNLHQSLNNNLINKHNLNQNETNDKMSNIPIIEKNDSSTSNFPSKTNVLKYLKSKKKSKSKQTNTTINYNIIHSTNIKIGSTTKHMYNLNNFQDHDHVSVSTCNEQEPKKMLPHIQALSNSTVEITKDDIFLIKTHIGNGWKKLAKKIGFSKGQIEQFLEDHKYKGINEVLYHILIDWKQSCTKEATIGYLICIMWSCQEYDCVERLVAAHNKILNMN